VVGILQCLLDPWASWDPRGRGQVRRMRGVLVLVRGGAPYEIRGTRESRIDGEASEIPSLVLLCFAARRNGTKD
jgi:hypothetical protein